MIGEVKGSSRKKLKGDSVTVQTVFDAMEEGTSFACHMAGELPSVTVPVSCSEELELDMTKNSYFVERSKILLN